MRALGETARLLNARPALVAQRALAGHLSARAPVQRAPAPNRTGLPNRLKSGIEALSGIAMDDVRVHRNSSRPAQLQAHAYAQGSDIHLAPGQDHHLPHEAWHVVQQKQGRVKPTLQLKAGVPVNDDAGLEREADRMGARAARAESGATPGAPPAQRRMRGGIAAADEAPVQRHLAIAGANVEARPADRPLGAAVATVIDDWIGDAAIALDYGSWEVAEQYATAVEWLKAKGWNVPPADIVDPHLFAGNCHSLTFPGSDLDHTHPAGDFLNAWKKNGSGDVLICLQGKKIAHSATRAGGGRWRQTLPDGPIFVTGLDLLKTKYECYDLSDAEQLAVIEEMAQESDAAFEKARNDFLNKWKALYKGINAKNADEDLQYHLKKWYLAVETGEHEYGEVDLSTIQDWNSQLEDMERDA